MMLGSYTGYSARQRRPPDQTAPCSARNCPQRLHSAISQARTGLSDREIAGIVEDRSQWLSVADAILVTIIQRKEC